MDDAIIQQIIEIAIDYFKKETVFLPAIVL